MIKCIAIDDEPLALEVIKAHLQQIQGVELIATFNNPVEAYDIIKSEGVELIFLDIEMPLLSGIDFLKTLSNPPKVIFTTAYRNYAIESYELDVVDYLLKPISFTRFFKAVNKYRNLTNSVFVTSEILTDDKADHLYVNANKKFVKVIFEEILYVESMKDYLRIYLTNGQVITKDTISNFEEKLSDNFLRIHRSFIVNKTKVTAFTKADVEIGEIEIPIGASYKETVIEALNVG